MVEFIDVRAPRREVVLYLPELRAILLSLFQSHGYEFREPASLRYQTTLSEDDHQSAVISVRLLAPVTGLIVGKWLTPPHEPTHILRFQVEILEFNMQAGLCPFTAMAENMARTVVTSVGELAAPVADVRSTNGGRELRAIDL